MSFHFQERDFRAFTELGELGLMSSDQLFVRHYSREDADVTRVYFNRRMREFAKADLVEKTDVVLSGNKGIQKQPSVFRLRPDGADELYRHTGYEARRVARSKPPSILTMVHRVGVSETLLAFKDAAKQEKLGLVRWLLETDQDRDAKLGESRDKKFILTELFQVGREQYSCRPDASLALAIPKADRNLNLLGYVEYDRSTEGQDQILRTKVEGYSLLLSSKRFEHHWPDLKDGIVRVLFVCKSIARIRNLQEWLGISRNPEIYRFTLHEHLSAGILSNPVWWGMKDNLDEPGLSILHGRKPRD